MIGICVAIPFFLWAVKKKSFYWTTPGGFSIAASKYYSVTEYYRMLNEDESLIDYWKKSKKFQADLNKVERYVKARKAAQ